MTPKAIDVAAFEAEGDIDNSTTEKGERRAAGLKSEDPAEPKEEEEEDEKENRVTQPTDEFDVIDKDNQVRQ